MHHKTLKNKEKIFAVAPMMDWSDRHYRFFARQFTKESLLYTEMVVADAIIHGDIERHLGFTPAEHPIALQLGGSEPDKLVIAARAGAEYGYDEINLNVGCPSDRVQSGTFGASLMRHPLLVAQCVEAMKTAVDIPVTVKCRLGVDEQDTEMALDAMANNVFAAGCDGLWVHARKAWLKGLSPKDNRDVPPLDYQRVYRLKQRLGDKFIGINGGFIDLEGTLKSLSHVDGVMMGRTAYHQPEILGQVDREIFGSPELPISTEGLLTRMCDYADNHLASGGRLNHITRHMLGLFHGRPGARRYRQIMTVEAAKDHAGIEVLERAFAAVQDQSIV